MLRRLLERLKTLWKLAKSERASPREIGLAVALGAFAGCTPAVGLHGWLAIGLATLLKKNRLFCWLGSRVCNIVTLPFIVYAEVQVSHRARTGVWLDLTPQRALDEAGMLLLDWCLGTLPVGGALALLLGGGAWAFASSRQKKRRARSADDEPGAGEENARPEARATTDNEAAIADPESVGQADPRG